MQRHLLTFEQQWTDAARRHLTRYCGVLSSHASLRSQVVPQPPTEPKTTATDKAPGKSKYIPWAELLRRTFAIEIKCGKCGSPLRLIALIKTREVIEKILVAMRVVLSSALFPSPHRISGVR